MTFTKLIAKLIVISLSVGFAIILSASLVPSYSSTLWVAGIVSIPLVMHGGYFLSVALAAKRGEVVQ